MKNLGILPSFLPSIIHHEEYSCFSYRFSCHVFIFYFYPAKRTTFYSWFEKERFPSSTAAVVMMGIEEQSFPGKTKVLFSFYFILCLFSNLILVYSFLAQGQMIELLEVLHFKVIISLKIFPWNR